jgi:anti-anti-sigma factor
MVATLEDVHVDRSTPGVSVVRFTGEHDLATSSSISELFDYLFVSSQLIVADVSAAQFIDSSMLRVLIEAHAFARELGREFRVHLGSKGVVGRTFQISGLLEETEWVSDSDGRYDGSPPVGSNGKAAR